MVLKRQLLGIVGISAAALVVVFAGCGLFSSRDGGFVFNHAVHLKNNLACDSCHEDYADGPGAGMPAYEVCLACHGPSQDKAQKPFELEIQKHSPQETFAAGGRYDDLKFSHALHHSKEVECKSCHGDVD